MAQSQTTNDHSDLRLRFPGRHAGSFFEVEAWMPSEIQAISPLVDRLMRLIEGSHCVAGEEPAVELASSLNLSGLRSKLNRDTALAKTELQKHLSEVRMTPTKEGEDWHYVAEGDWDLLGTGPNAPVLGLAHSDGCGGQI